MTDYPLESRFPLLQEAVELFLRTKRYNDAQAIILEAAALDGPLDTQNVMSAAMGNVIHTAREAA